MAFAKVRVVNVRPKFNVVSILPTQLERDDKALRNEIELTLASHGSKKLGGMLMVVWDTDLSSTVGCWTSMRNTIPRIAVVDFFRNRITAEVTEQWTINAINKANGY